MPEPEQPEDYWRGMGHSQVKHGQPVEAGDEEPERSVIDSSSNNSPVDYEILPNGEIVEPEEEEEEEEEEEIEEADVIDVPIFERGEDIEFDFIVPVGARTLFIAGVAIRKALVDSSEWHLPTAPTLNGKNLELGGQNAGFREAVGTAHTVVMYIHEENVPWVKPGEKATFFSKASEAKGANNCDVRWYLLYTQKRYKTLAGASSKGTNYVSTPPNIVDLGTFNVGPLEAPRANFQVAANGFHGLPIFDTSHRIHGELFTPAAWGANASTPKLYGASWGVGFEYVPAPGTNGRVAIWQDAPYGCYSNSARITVLES